MAKVASPPSSTVSPLPLSCLINKLRWSNIGHFYHWGTKSYQFDRELVPIPCDIKNTCQRAVINVQWSDVWKDGAGLESGEWEMDKPDWDRWPETFRWWVEHRRILILMIPVVPDAGIINFYQLKVNENVCPAWRDMLNAFAGYAHGSCRSFRTVINIPISIYIVKLYKCTAALTHRWLRLGQAAIFLIGGLTRDEKAIPIVLRSGDVLIMSGPRCRRAFHG
jgi:alkylated DNA repair protein alkB homolog 1